MNEVSAPDVGPMPALRADLLAPPDLARLEPARRTQHPPRILLLYGSLRERSFSRLLVEEADRLLRLLGAETRIFDPRELPMANGAPADHPKVAELRALSLWSEGQVWCSLEVHGAVTGVFKKQVDWLPLELGSVRPTQGRTLAAMQVSGGSQSFNAVNTLRLLGRWMRMFTIPNQSSVPRAYEQFDEAGRMKPSANCVRQLAWQDDRRAHPVCPGMPEVGQRHRDPVADQAGEFDVLQRDRDGSESVICFYQGRSEAVQI